MLRNEIFLFIAKKLEGKKGTDKPTIYGITEENYPKFYYRIKTLAENNSPLLKQAIIDAYNHIYESIHADKVPYPLNWYYFDFAFNAGEKAALKKLQKAYNVALNKSISVDGIWGPQTEKALQGLSKKETIAVLCEYMILRRDFYTHLVSLKSLDKKKREEFCKYYPGWINRVGKLDRKVFHVVLNDFFKE